MAFDQNIKYKVSVDDSDFQAKLTQMRASMDMTMGGYGGGGGMGMGYGGFGSMMGGGLGQYMMAGQTSMMMSGLSDFGSQVRPVTYTPPAIAMQPHFGMFALQQTTGQAFLGSFGAAGIGAQASLQFARHPLSGLPGDPISNRISYSEYTNLSARAFGTRLGDTASAATLAAGGTVASLAAGGIGEAIGAAAGLGFVGTTALSLGLSIPVDMLASSVSDMVVQNRGIQSQLEAGSFRFIGGGPDADLLTGRGFSRRARANVADFIQTQELNDPRFGMGEMRGVLESGMQLDLFSGTRDAEEFKKRFSDLKDSVKTIMSTLHTSLKEGMEVIRGFRDMGVVDPNQINSLTMQAETVGRMSGRTGMEMLAIGQTGAELFRGTGVNMQLGMQMNMMNTANVRELLNQGLVSREQIGQLGGENSAAQMMTAGALASTQTAFGRGLMMANFDPASGAFSPNMMSNMASGDMVGMLRNATKLSPQQILQFQAKQEDLISSMSPMGLQMFEVGQIAAQAKFLSRSLPGLSVDDAFTAVGRQMGKSIDQIRIMQGMLHEDPEKIRQDQESAIESMGAQAAGEEFRNRFSLKGKVTNVLRRTLVQPFQRELTGISTAIGESWDRTVMRLEGRNPVNMATLGTENVRMARALAENPNVAVDTDHLGGVQDLTGSMWSRAFGPSTTQAASDLMQFGTNLSARQLADSNLTGGTFGAIGGVSFMGGTALKFRSEADVRAYADKTHNDMMILRSDKDNVVAISREEEKKVQDRRSQLMPTSKDLEAVDKFKTSDDVGLRLEKLASAESATSGGVSMERLENVLMKDESFKKLSLAARAAVIEREGQRFGLTKAVGEVQAGRGRAQGDVGALSATISMGEAESAADRLKSTFKGSSRTNFDVVGGMDFDALSQISTIVSTTGAAQTKAAKDLRGTLEKKGMSPDAINRIIAQSEGEIANSLRSSGKLSQISADVTKVQQATEQGLSMTRAAGGAITGTSSGDIGLLTKDTLNTMRTMSDALVKNMEMIVKFQKEFNSLVGSK